LQDRCYTFLDCRHVFKGKQKEVHPL
jgi:hypothetical protein